MVAAVACLTNLHTEYFICHFVRVCVCGAYQMGSDTETIFIFGRYKLYVYLYGLHAGSAGPMWKTLARWPCGKTHTHNTTTSVAPAGQPFSFFPGSLVLTAIRKLYDICIGQKGVHARLVKLSILPILYSYGCVWSASAFILNRILLSLCTTFFVFWHLAFSCCFLSLSLFCNFEVCQQIISVILDTI